MSKNKKFKKDKDPAAALGSFSKNLLGLKFMQRAKAQLEASSEAKEDSFDLSIEEKFKNAQQCVVSPSYQFCERLRFGRFSFKGMNLDIEAIMERNKPGGGVGEKRPASDDGWDGNEIDDFGTDEDQIDDDALLADVLQ